MGARMNEVVKVVLFIVSVIGNIPQCDGKHKPVGRVMSFDSSKTMKSPTKSAWQPEGEEEEPASVFPPITPNNVVPVVSGVEPMISQILETVATNENYLKKIINIDHRTRNIDDGISNVNEVIKKYFDGISEQLEMGNAQDKEVIREIKHLRKELSQVVNVVKENFPLRKSGQQDDSLGMDSKCESKLSNVQETLRVLKDSVEQILSTIVEVKRRGSLRSNRKTDPNSDSLENMSSLVNEFKRVLREKSNKCDCNKSARSFDSFPADCAEIQNLGFNISGIYKVKPEECDAFYVLCDMHSAGGGWTVFQNRFDGSQDFYKPWAEYKHGFGNLAGEFWLGLEKIHYISNQKLYELRIELESHVGEEVYASYTVFSIGPEVEGYRISTIGSYSGDAGDSLTYHSGQKFTTLDVDNDEWKDGICAVEHGGAWWYRECDKSNLNGRYNSKSDTTFKSSHGIYWNTFKGPTNLLMRTRMMVRPLPVSHTVPATDGTVSASVTSTKFLDLTRKNSLKRERHPKAKKSETESTAPIELDEYQEDAVSRWSPVYQKD